MEDKQNKVLEFPKNKSLKKRIFDRQNEKKSIIALSLASVFLVTLLMNDWLQGRNQNLAAGVDGQSRLVASVNEANLKKDIEWEHEVARELSSIDSNKKGFRASKPSLKDELIYGYLAGHYNVEFKDAKIVSIEINPSRHEVAADSRLDEVVILEKFKPLFVKNYDKIRWVPSADNSMKNYELLDKKNQVVGQVRVEYNQEGQIQKLIFL